MFFFGTAEGEIQYLTECYALCVCNWFGCNCDGCENTGITAAAAGSCRWSDGGCEKYGGYMGYSDPAERPWVSLPTCYGDFVDDEDERRQMMDGNEKKDGCGDFNYF